MWLGYNFYQPDKTIARKNQELAHCIQSLRVLAIYIQDEPYHPRKRQMLWFYF